MSGCSRIKPMLSGLLNQELNSSDINDVQVHLSRCAQCRQYLSSLPDFKNKNLQEVMMSSLQSTLSFRSYAVLTTAAMVFCIGGYIAFAGHGFISFIQDPEEPVFFKSVAMVIFLGVGVLFLVVAYQRYIRRKHDPYQEVEK